MQLGVLGFGELRYGDERHGFPGRSRVKVASLESNQAYPVLDLCQQGDGPFDEGGERRRGIGVGQVLP